MRHIFSFTATLVCCGLLAIPAMTQTRTTTTPMTPTAPKAVVPATPTTTVAPTTKAKTTTTTAPTTTTRTTTKKTKTQQELIELKKAGLGWTRGKKPGVHKEEMTPEQKKAAAQKAQEKKVKACNTAKDDCVKQQAALFKVEADSPKMKGIFEHCYPAWSKCVSGK